MGTLQMPPPLTTPRLLPPNSPPLYFRRSHQLPNKTIIRARSSGLQSFMDLSHESKPEYLAIDLQWHEPSNSSSYDAVILGCGPAGLRVAEQVSAHGVRVCCIDPSPLLAWPNNYGVWVDEFEAMGLEGCLDKVWPMTTIFIDDRKTRYLGRPYGRVCRKRLKTQLLEECASNGVKFHKAKACKVEHKEFSSAVSCSDGSKLKASMVVDATGFGSPFLQHDEPRRNHGYQIAHGILAEVEGHPFDVDKMVLMDWRDLHMSSEPCLRPRNDKLPTFLYAMPFDSKLIFLEETSLVSRPVLPYVEVKRRMVARLRHLGIKVKRVIEDEKCLIPMGGALPVIPQNVMGIGGAAGLVHPSTGYMVARTLALAPVVADAMAECLGSTRMIRGRQLYSRVWSALWTGERRRSREFYCFGMETLLRLDLKGTRRFFDAFFHLDPCHWEGFLSSRLSLGELLALSLSLFGHASNPSKLDIVTKCTGPFARLMGTLALQSI